MPTSSGAWRDPRRAVRMDATPGENTIRPDPTGGSDSTGPTGTMFVGEFASQEQAFLSRQFGRCRFELLARSVLDDRIALVRWLPLTRAGPTGPRPLFAAPNQATYVLDFSGGSGADRGDSRPVDGPTRRLSRVDTTAALAASYPRHFPGVQLQTPGWLRLRCAWYRLIPLLVVVLGAIWLALGAIWLALGAIWLALVLWQARGP